MAIFKVYPLVILSFSFALANEPKANEPIIKGPLVKDDFAFGHSVTLTENKAIAEVVLPESVYQNCQSANLLDLAIFNSQNEVVPHSIRGTEPKVISQPSPEIELPLFPIYSLEVKDSPFSEIKVSTHNDGSILEIKSTKTAEITNENNKRVIGYIVDAAKISEPIKSFKINIPPQLDNYFIKLQIDGSNDLNSWDHLNLQSVVARFGIESEKIQKDQIPLSERQYKYYRLSWQNMSETDLSIKLDKLIAQFPEKKEVVKASLNWKVVTGTKQEQQQSNEIIYDYDLGGFYPLSGIKVKFKDPNSTMRVLIQAAPNSQGPWSQFEYLTFFDVSKSNMNISELEKLFPERSFRYWRLHLVSNPSGIGSTFPEVSFGWRPQSVLFLARGQSPFYLTYGSAKVKNHPQEGLINPEWSNEQTLGIIGEKITMGGPEKLLIIENQTFPWKKYTLWGVLVLAVILLLSMSVQLRKQLNTNQENR